MATLILLVLQTLGPAAAQTPADPPRGDFRFVVLGDFNGPYGSLEYPSAVDRALDAVTEIWKPDLLLSPGDVVAGQSRSLPEDRFAEMWRVFDAQFASPLRQAGIPYAVALGNHDASSLRGPGGEYLFERERRAARSYWSQPMYQRNLVYADRSRFPHYYAFSFREAFVIVLDASSARLDPDQLDWLRRMLEVPAATAAKARIVMGHLPILPISEGRDRPGEFLEDGATLRGMLEAASVDLYISGHQAAYYPARLGDLELLFAGGIGARRLLAGTQPPRSTVTVVDVLWEPLDLSYTTFDVTDMSPLPPAALPASIGDGERALHLSGRAKGLQIAGRDGVEGQN